MKKIILLAFVCLFLIACQPKVEILCKQVVNVNRETNAATLEVEPGVYAVFRLDMAEIGQYVLVTYDDFFDEYSLVRPVRYFDTCPLGEAK